MTRTHTMEKSGQQGTKISTYFRKKSFCLLCNLGWSSYKTWVGSGSQSRMGRRGKWVFVMPERGMHWASLVDQMVKHLPAMWETRVWSLGWEDPLEKEMATHCSTPAWKIPWMEEPGGLQSMGSQRVGHDWVISLSFFLSFLWDKVRKKNWNHRRESWWKAFLLTVIDWSRLMC